MPEQDADIERLRAVRSAGGAGLRVLFHASNPGPAESVLAAALPWAGLICHDSHDGVAELLQRSPPGFCLSCRFGPGYPRAPLVEGPHAPACLPVAGTGFNHLPLFDSDRLPVCNSAGFQAPVMADYALAAIYSINLDLAHFHAQQARRDWTGRMPRSAEGQHAAILGTGPIGAAVARKLTATGLQITAISRSGRAHPEFARVQPVDGLAAVAAAADHVVIAIPLAEATRGLASAHILAAMPAGAEVVNLTRGGIVDEGTLLAGLRGGNLRGAVFDVFATEQLPSDYPLWHAPGMIVTPHAASLFDRWAAAMAWVFADNLDRQARGEAPLNRVDPARGY